MNKFKFSGNLAPKKTIPSTLLRILKKRFNYLLLYIIKVIYYLSFIIYVAHIYLALAYYFFFYLVSVIGKENYKNMKKILSAA